MDPAMRGLVDVGLWVTCQTGRVLLMRVGRVARQTGRAAVEEFMTPGAITRRRGGPRYAGSCWWHVGLDTPTEWGGEENVVLPARNGQEARWTPLCGVLLMGACGWTPRGCGVENIECSPRPHWAGSAVDPTMRGL